MSEAEQFFSRLNSSYDKIAEMLEENGPQAVDMTLQIVRIDAAFDVALCLVSLCLSYCGYRLARHALAKALNGKNQHDEGLWFGAFMISCITSPLFALVGIIHLFSPATWISLFDPRMGLAYRALQGTIL